jgi:hypothetical protein
LGNIINIMGTTHKPRDKPSQCLLMKLKGLKHTGVILLPLSGRVTGLF